MILGNAEPTAGNGAAKTVKINPLMFLGVAAGGVLVLWAMTSMMEKNTRRNPHRRRRRRRRLR